MARRASPIQSLLLLLPKNIMFSIFPCLCRRGPRGPEKEGINKRIALESPHPDPSDSGVDKRVVFQKGGFGGGSPGTKTGTRVHSDVPPERKPKRGYVRIFPRNENRNEGTFTKNRPFVCQPPTIEGASHPYILYVWGPLVPSKKCRKNFFVGWS